MDFSTSSFWCGFAVALLALLLGNAILGRRGRARRIFHKCWLTVSSLTLLGMASWQTLLIFLGVAGMAWLVCTTGLKTGMCTRRILLGISLPIMLLPLFVYKYSDFVVNGVLGQDIDCLRDLVIPVGISFYSFQLIGFCIDTLLRGQNMPRPWDFLNFGAFFPQIVAGPIEKREDLLPQMQNPDLRLRATALQEAIPYIILGLFFKLALADNLAAAFYRDYAGGNALTVWTNNLLFSFRIYFDFAGYGLVAYGLAKLLGVSITLNFMSPYTTTNAGDFWRCWNISLFRWLKDYIYIPLGGNRTRYALATVLLVFLVSGIWHGAGWNFLIWGSLAGLSVIGVRLFRRVGGRMPALFGWVITFGLMVFVWMFFYDTDMATLQKHLKLLASPGAYSPQGFIKELIDREWYGTMVLPFLGLSAVVLGVEALSRLLKQNPYALFLSPYACGLMVYLIVLLNNTQQTPFIYFSF